SGKLRAQVTIGADGMTQPTGWHYHVCEGQFVYMLSGWVDLEFEDGQKLRIQAGESLYIPGGPRHHERAASRYLELLEISVPADMGTVACDPPEGWSKSAGRRADGGPPPPPPRPPPPRLASARD